MNPHHLLRKIPAAIAAAVLAIASAAAQGTMPYTVHELSGDVKVSRAGKTTPAEKGMGVRGSDNLVLADGARIGVLHKAMRKIYVWDTPGTISVGSMMIKARHMAADNSRAFHSLTTFSKRDKAEAQTVYSTVGRTTRSMAKYDPDARDMTVDPAILARVIAPGVLAAAPIADGECPVSFTHTADSVLGGASFTMANTLAYPVYFNVIKVTNTPGDAPRVEISELGQPTGNYVVRPGQTLARGQQSGLRAADRHIVVMTQCFFDIDKLLEALDSALAAPAAADSAVLPAIPVFTGAIGL